MEWPIWLHAQLLKIGQSTNCSMLAQQVQNIISERNFLENLKSLLNINLFNIHILSKGFIRFLNVSELCIFGLKWKRKSTTS